MRKIVILGKYIFLKDGISKRANDSVKALKRQVGPNIQFTEYWGMGYNRS